MEECKQELEKAERVKFYNQLEKWHEEGKHQDIVDEIDKEIKQDYHISLLKIKALLNLSNSKEAHSQLLKTKEQGKNHSIWHLYLSQVQEALGNNEEANVAKEQFTQLKKKEDQYVTIINSEDYISVPFYIEKERILKIGQKLNEINEQAYMNGYNWEVLLQYYVNKNYPKLSEHLEHDPEAGMYVGYFKNTPKNEERANTFKEIITDLVENEEKLYGLVRNEGGNIDWD